MANGKAKIHPAVADEFTHLSLKVVKEIKDIVQRGRQETQKRRG